VEEEAAEIVERKGIGHPDSICDAMMEDIALALCREYRAAFGKILHFNVDKCLLAAGKTEPRLGGGKVIEPMRLIFGDRATVEFQGKRVDIGGIAEAASKAWIRRNLRFVNPDTHVIFQDELREGSPELADIFKRRVVGANDTSVAFGHAPLSETERLVLACEHYLNSVACKQRFPEAGEDIKVMGYRRGRVLDLTVAIAFVDRFVPDSKFYFIRKQEIAAAVEEHLRPQLRNLDRISVVINTLDDPARGTEGMYLTVLGTSAEGGDCGQVGRGNRINGLISLNRPLGAEAVAGKNPVSHVGKIYTFLSHELARKIYETVPGVREVYVWLGSQIGRPIDQPAMVFVSVVLQSGYDPRDVQPAVRPLVEAEFASIDHFVEDLINGSHPVC
jgi:S-adenosylmethionine synthetase